MYISLSLCIYIYIYTHVLGERIARGRFVCRQSTNTSTVGTHV